MWWEVNFMPAVISPLNRSFGWAPEPIYMDPSEERRTCLYRKPNYISLNVQPTIHDLSSVLFAGYLRLKWPGYKVSHSHPSSIEVKNECSCTSAPPVWLPAGMYRDSFRIALLLHIVTAVTMVTFVTEVTKGSPVAVVTFVTVLNNVNIDFLVTMITFTTRVMSW